MGYEWRQRAYRFQTLQLEAIDRPAFAAVHVVAKCQNDLEKFLQLLALLDAQRSRAHCIDLRQEILVRVREVGNEAHDVELLRETFDFGERKEELVLFGESANVLAAFQVGVESLELLLGWYEMLQDVNLVDWQSAQIEAKRRRMRISSKPVIILLHSQMARVVTC